MKGNPPTRPSFSPYTAISRKVVGKSARDNQKFERLARAAMDVCLRVLKESNKSRFDSYSVRNSVLIISHITFLDCRVLIFFLATFLEIAVNTLAQPASARSRRDNPSMHERCCCVGPKGYLFSHIKAQSSWLGGWSSFPGHFFSV